MKKILKITLKIIAGILLLALLAVFSFKVFDMIKYRDFYSKAQKEFVIPALNDGYVPQGFEYCKEKDLFLSSGYMKNGESSRIYVTDRKGVSYGSILQDENGEPYTSHVGGITYFDKYLYIADSDGLDVFLLDDILDKEKTSVKKIGRVSTFDVKASFCTSNGSEIFAGSFHREENYKTDEKFHLTTPSGEENKGIMISLKFDKYAEFGIDASSPTAYYSIPSLVQGVAITEENIILSTSYGLSPSKLYIHDIEKLSQKNNPTFGEDIPLYYVDSNSLIDTITPPPMAEEIIYLNDKIWIMNESASNKYIFGKITSGYYAHSIEY